MFAELTILGNNSAAPTLTRNQSSQHLKLDQDRILFDCGEGTQKQLIVNRINYQKISYIFISHLHGDHFLGLMGLLNTMALNGRHSKITIVAPIGLQKLYTLYAQTSEAHQTFEIQFIELEPEVRGIIDAPRFEVEYIPVSHRVSCFAYIFMQKKPPRQLNIDACNAHQISQTHYNKLKAGEDVVMPDGTSILNEVLTRPATPPSTYGYITDTLYRPDLAPEFAHCHTVYHEATYLHNFLDRAIKTHHSTALQAGMFAKKASVNQLLIGHFSSRYHNTDEHLQESQSEFKETFIAEEGKTFKIYGLSTP